MNKSSHSCSSRYFQVSGCCLKALLWLSNDCLMTSPWLYSKFTPKYMDSFDMSTNSKSGLTIIWIVLVQISQTFNLFWRSESHWSILRFFKDQARASDPVTSKLDFYAGNAFQHNFSTIKPIQMKTNITNNCVKSHGGFHLHLHWFSLSSTSSILEWLIYYVESTFWNSSELCIKWEASFAPISFQVHQNDNWTNNFWVESTVKERRPHQQ